MRSHVTLLQGKVVSCTEHKTVIRGSANTAKTQILFSMFYVSPERGVDLQGFAEHLGSNVIHVVPAQVHFSQAGVATQGVDQHRAPGAQA